MFSKVISDFIDYYYRITEIVTVHLTFTYFPSYRLYVLHSLLTPVIANCSVTHRQTDQTQKWLTGGAQPRSAWFNLCRWAGGWALREKPSNQYRQSLRWEFNWWTLPMKKRCQSPFWLFSHELTTLFNPWQLEVEQKKQPGRCGGSWIIVRCWRRWCPVCLL